MPQSRCIERSAQGSSSRHMKCLCHELHLRGITFQRQAPLPVNYKGMSLDCGYRLDIVVADTLILELKGLEHVLPVHEAQLLTYLKMTDKRVAIIFNFHVAALVRVAWYEK